MKKGTTAGTSIGRTGVEKKRETKTRIEKSARENFTTAMRPLQRIQAKRNNCLVLIDCICVELYEKTIYLLCDKHKIIKIYTIRDVLL